LLTIWGLLTGCGLSEQDRIATRVAEEVAIGATLTAIANNSQPIVPSPTQTSPVATETPVESTATATLMPQTGQALQTTAATPTILPKQCIVVADFLNLRNGPGIVYNPPLVTLEKGAVLQPIAYSPEGYPGGRWIEVQVLTNDISGWTSADPQFVACNLDITQLSPGNPPPPPKLDLPEKTGGLSVPVTVFVLYYLMPSDERDHNIFWQVVIPGSSSDELDGNNLVFQNQVVFRIDAYDRTVSTINGAGIDRVHIEISKEDRVVYEKDEKHAPYCFSPSNSYSCQPWVFANHSFRWPNGETIEDGEYRVIIEVYPEDGLLLSGWFTFRIERPIISQQVDSTCDIIYPGTDGLNFRAGPGVNYNPPITTLYQGTRVTPLGRNQDGSWIKVTEPGNGLIGWVKAEAQYISCNLDITTLPYVEESTQPPAPEGSNTPPYIAESPQSPDPENSNSISVENALRTYYTLIGQKQYEIAWAMVREYNTNKGLSYDGFKSGWEESGSATIVEPMDVIDKGDEATVILRLYYPKKDVQYTFSYELERDEQRGDPQFGYWLFVKGTLLD
jgi:uncharacterized protein YraI